MSLANNLYNAYAALKGQCQVKSDPKVKFGKTKCSCYRFTIKCSKCIKCINSAERFHSTEVRVNFRSIALWVAIPQFPQSPLPIGILG
ncbi:hypothetical protein UY3_10065 [Chelonia mydas]|uniref:Uncharacterized protein n=1 Tax=Chelonia mydas TaxID=8469 RepID=M7BLA1_CHEMY|nr:hypothetical protein UY3_10065 [Chelonia mydas]